VISFLIGIAVSVVAATPSWLLMWGGKGAEWKQRLKLWGIGTGLRFAIIGAALYYLFTQTSVERVTTVIGVAAAYLILYIIETITSLRA
jgi:hypothetical protein